MYRKASQRDSQGKGLMGGGIPTCLRADAGSERRKTIVAGKKKPTSAPAKTPTRGGILKTGQESMNEKTGRTKKSEVERRKRRI